MFDRSPGTPLAELIDLAAPAGGVPLPSQPATRQPTPGDDADALVEAERQQLPLLLRVEHVVVRSGYCYAFCLRQVCSLGIQCAHADIGAKFHSGRSSGLGVVG